MPDTAAPAGVSKSRTSPTRVGLWARLTPTSLLKTLRIVFAVCKLAWAPIVCSIFGSLLFLLPDQSQDSIRATLDIKDWNSANLGYVVAFFVALLLWALSAYVWARLMTMHPRALNKLPREYDEETARKCRDVLPRVLGFSVFFMMAVVVACIVLQLPLWVYLPLGLPFVPLMITLLIRFGDKPVQPIRALYLLLVAIHSIFVLLWVLALTPIHVDHASVVLMLCMFALMMLVYRPLLMLFQWLLFRPLLRLLRWLASKLPLRSPPRLSQWRKGLSWTSTEWTILKLVNAFFVPAFLLLASSAELSFLTRMQLYVTEKSAEQSVLEEFYEQGDKQAIEITISNHRGKSVQYIHDAKDLGDVDKVDVLSNLLSNWRTLLALSTFSALGMLTLSLGRLLDGLLGWRENAASDTRSASTIASERDVWYPKIVFFIVAAGLVVLFTFFPVTVGQFLRPATVIGLFIPILISALSLLSWYSLYWRKRLVSIAFTAWFGLGFLFDNHFVRPLEPTSPSGTATAPNRTTVELASLAEGPGVPNDGPPSRPTVEQAFDVWYKVAQNIYCKGQPCEPGTKVPIVLVATAGGGIRAAYWTATVLGTLQDEHPELADSLFGISGVSGGALGAAVFRALLTEQGRGRKLPECRTPDDFVGPLQPSFARCGQKVLDRDSLGPTLGVMLFPDLLRRVAPKSLPAPIAEWDRARALEMSWEDGWQRATGSNLLAEDFNALWQKNKPYPALFLNGTSVKSGRRIITSNLSLSAKQEQADGEGQQKTESLFPDAFDFFEQSGMRIRASTAVNNSARFPVIGSAGTFESSKDRDKKDQVVDGGYFENYGATTALDLADAIRRHHQKKGKDETGLHFVFVQISSDPTLPEEGQDSIVPAGAIANGLAAPVWALTATRTARGTYQAALAINRMSDFGENGTYVHFRLGVGYGHAAPLGWVLSDSAKHALGESMTSLPNRCENYELEKALDGGVSEPVECKDRKRSRRPRDTGTVANAR